MGSTRPTRQVAREREDARLIELARFAAGLSAFRLPEDVSESARKRLADFVAIASRGLGAPGPRELVTKSGVSGPANLFDTGSTDGAPNTAWIASAAGHALGLDDFHPASTVHPGVVVIPAVLARAQDLRSSLKTVESAIVAGYEVATRFGCVLPKGHVHKCGFHPTTVFGLLGATVGCLCLEGASEKELLDGLGLSACFAGGLARFGGDPAVKALEVGNAARLAVDVAGLVAAGVTGPSSSLSFGNGLLHAVGHKHGVEADRLVEGLGTQWEILATSFKPWAQGTNSHVAVAAALEARRSLELAPAGIAEVRVEIPGSEPKRIAVGSSQGEGVRTAREAQQDPAHCIAVALAAGATGSDAFDPLVDWYEDLDRLNAPAILGLRDRVRWVGAHTTGPQATVHILGEHGQHAAATMATFPGDATANESGLTWDHIEQRGRCLTGESGAWWHRFLDAVRTAQSDFQVTDLLAIQSGVMTGVSPTS